MDQFRDRTSSLSSNDMQLERSDEPTSSTANESSASCHSQAPESESTVLRARNNPVEGGPGGSGVAQQRDRKSGTSESTIARVRSIFEVYMSNKKLHCCLFVLILFQVTFLWIPYKLITKANEQYSKRVPRDSLEKLRIAGLRKVNCTHFALNSRLSFVEANGLCAPGTFQCKSVCDNICIRQEFNCNKVADCPNASDEEPLECLDTYGLTQVWFAKLQEALQKRVNASENKHAYANPENCTLDEMVFGQCPCNLTDPRVIICENLGLTRIPNAIPASVFKIRMINNSIEDLDQVAWPGNLEKLILQENRLSALENGTFVKVPKLRGLFLNQNHISRIELDAFMNLGNLTILHLNDNSISKLDLRVFGHTPSLATLNLSSNQLNSMQDMRFREIPNLTLLTLDHNGVKLVPKETFSGMRLLEDLSLKNNEIEFISEKAFEDNENLRSLYLSNNKLKQLNRNTFISLVKLKKLYLDKNRIEELTPDTFVELRALKSLKLEENPFRSLKQEWFSYMNLSFIYFSHFRYCYYATNARVCKPHSDGLSSNKSMLHPELKNLVWGMASVCSVGNVCVFVWRSLWPTEQDLESLIIRNLSIADLLMGVYLLAVARTNEQFGNEFGRRAVEWMSSSRCSLMGFLAILSSQLSILILCLISIERYRTITAKYRVDPIELTSRTCRYLKVVWLLAIVIALIPFLASMKTQQRIYGNNPLCLPLYLNDPLAFGWQFSAIVHLGLNFSIVMTILILYIRLYLLIMATNRNSSAIMANPRRQEAIIALRFLFIVVTDCFCWIPVVVIKFLALVNYPITHNIYGWLAVAVLPINSAVNPIIYTLAAKSRLRTIISLKLTSLIIYLKSRLKSTRARSRTSDGFITTDDIQSPPEWRPLTRPECRNQRQEAGSESRENQNDETSTTATTNFDLVCTLDQTQQSARPKHRILATRSELQLGS